MWHSLRHTQPPLGGRPPVIALTFLLSAGLFSGCGGEPEEQVIKGRTSNFPFMGSDQRADATAPNCTELGNRQVQISDGADKVLKVVELGDAEPVFDKTIWKCVQTYEATVEVADVYKIVIAGCDSSERVVNRSDLKNGVGELFGCK